MSSIAVRRRSRSHIETEHEADNARFGSRPCSPLNVSKKMRLRGGGGEDDGHTSSTDSDSDVTPARNNQKVTGNGAGPSDFPTGTIVRVKIENFISYELAEFFPGPNLNMVIGPNGTGKSSLVCAICLGLGYPPSVLGRATSIGEFVKHGKENATVEVELQKRPEDRANYTIRLLINREDNSRRFTLNGKDVTLKNLHRLMRRLRIQIDNLCQFLPQEKVAEFAGVNSVELLTRTLQAAAPTEIIDQQNRLREMFDERKAVERQLQINTETLRSLETRQQGIQADVERLREREQIQKRVADLMDACLIQEYNEKKKVFEEVRKHKKQAQRTQRRLEESYAPSLENINLKQEHENKVQTVLDARRQRAKEAEKKAEQALSCVEETRNKIQHLENKKSAEQESLSAKRQQISKVRQKITQLEGQHKSSHINFNAAEWNHKIREQQALEKEVGAQFNEVMTAKKEVQIQGLAKLKELKSQRTQLDDFNTQEGQRYHQLRKVQPEVATAWDWLQENSAAFEKPVFGPAMLTCSIKDKRYANQVQSLLQMDDVLCFTAQTMNDHKTLTEQFFQKMRLAVTVRTVTANLSTLRSLVPRESLNDMGLDGFALEFLEGPEPVLAMLCAEKKLHLNGVALKDVSDEQFERISDGGQVNAFATGSTMYRITRRKEYGPGATSTLSRTIQPGRYWTDEPLDMAAKREFEKRCTELQGDLAQLQELLAKHKTKESELDERAGDIKQEIARLESEKSTLQRDFNRWKHLPEMIETSKRDLRVLEDEMRETRQTLSLYDAEHEERVFGQIQHVLQHKCHLNLLRDANLAVTEAMVCIIEARSDIAALKERNSGIVERLEEERARIQELAREAEHAKKSANEALRAALKVISLGPGAEIDLERRNYLYSMTENQTVESLTGEIEAENAKLDLIQASDPSVLQDFEKRAREIERGRREKAGKDRRLEELQVEIQSLREKWEPELDHIINEINNAFSYNFEQINCAGEVSLHKDDDYNKWAIEVKVKFRENESLQRLDQHRQSGGERSVSTIFYLMALQSMAQSPFRVVDEINQGMDPRNERRVHERMVEIACHEHTSQYFLITPKLLSGLRYDERMKILCIASGEHMPVEGGKLDFSRCIKIKKNLLAASA